MMGHKKQLPSISGVFIEEICLNQPFEEAAARFAEETGTVLLLSGSGQDCARFHILAVWPLLTLASRGDRMTLSSRQPDQIQPEQNGQEEVCLTGDPFEVLQDILSQYALTGISSDLPAAAGLFGYFAYDLKDRIEALPRTSVATGLPDMHLVLPSVVLIQDRKEKKTKLCIPVIQGGEAWVAEIKERFLARLDRPWKDGGFRVDERGLASCFTKEEYVDAVNRILAYLRAGDIYQANLSQQFSTRFEGDAYGLFLELFRRNPAAFFSYIKAGDHVVVSTSPERFIQLEGSRVETRPIKGTLARGTDPESDRKNGEQLMASLKDDAELTMIVDLMRNDLSRVTVHDSVVVTEHKRLEPYDNVFHLVSVVEGEMLPGKTAVDLIRATFPGGSITGCPKIRSMEIIDELEPVRRHVYTGSIGYISFHGTMDLSIAIRTAIIHNHRLVFSVGGGIVYDSDPEKEFQETLDKGKTLMDALNQAAGGTLPSPRKAWVDGKLVNEDRAEVSATGQGFQYGAGVFETIRVEMGRPLFLPEHLRRMETSWKSLFKNDAPDITWQDVIALLVRMNGLEKEVCAVKLIAALDAGRGAVAAFIRPYTHRLDTLKRPGLELAVFPEPRQSPLADHKTLNYLVYDRAGAFAREQGKDEALILNPDGTVSETNTGNIFAVDGHTLVLPESGHVLPGVTLNRLESELEAQGYGVVRRPITWEALAALPNVMVSNSLMGAVRVMGINTRRIRHDDGLCDGLNRLLW